MQKNLDMGSKDFLTKQVNIKHKYPDDLHSHYVSNLVVQHEPGIFILSFFETWPPIILGETDEEKRKALEKMENIESKCVARLVITPENMNAFIEAMSENLKRYKHSMKAKNTEDYKE